MDETWKPVVGYEGLYWVSDQGRVKNKHGRVLKLKFHKWAGGYYEVALSKNRHRRQKFVHSIVAEAFIGPRPNGMHVCHGVLGSEVNTPDNLRYDTASANQKERGKIGPRKLNVDSVAAIKRKLIDGGYTQVQLAQEYNCSPQNIRQIKSGTAWKHVEPAPPLAA